MKIHSFFALIFFISQALHAEGLCRYSLKLDQARLDFASTTISKIEEKFGFTEKFKYGEFAGSATCYQADRTFLIFGFKPMNDALILWNATISALPPTGYDKSFCKKILHTDNLHLNTHHLGMRKYFPANFLNEENRSTSVKNDGRFECTLTENSIYANGRLIHYFIGLSEND